jgi:hypothetical protein
MDVKGKLTAPSRKRAVFLDGNAKLPLSSIKRAAFMARVWDICYICMI